MLNPFSVTVRKLCVAFGPRMLRVSSVNGKLDVLFALMDIMSLVCCVARLLHGFTDADHSHVVQ